MGGQVRGLHLQADGQVGSEERPCQACLGAAFLRDWCGQALVALRRDLRHGAGQVERRRHHECHQDRLRLPPRCHCPVLVAPRAQVPGDRSVLPLRPEAVTKNGIKFFEWENAKDLSKFKSMDGAQVQAELASSNYLKKWVD